MCKVRDLGPRGGGNVELHRAGRIALVLALLAGSAAADPLTVAATPSTHDGIAVAGGGPGWLVLWETSGLQRSIGGAIVARDGKLAKPARKLLDRAGHPDQLLAVWNGHGWTVATCNDTGTHTELSWGVVAANGAYTAKGTYSFGPTGLSVMCAAPTLEGGHVSIYAARRDYHFVATDPPTRCTAWRIDITGSKAVVGKPHDLCTVWAAVGDIAFGDDSRHRPSLDDGHGRHARAAVTRGSDVTGTTVVTRLQRSLQMWSAPFMKPARTIHLPTMPIDSDELTSITALPGGRVALRQRVSRDRSVFAIIARDGTLATTGSYGGARMLYEACSPDGQALLCAWTDEGTGGVHVQRLSR